jgi:glutaconate CoA-transferase subunit A
VTTTVASHEAAVELLAALVHDGDTVALGGVMARRSPVELAQALVDTGRRHLDAWSFLAGPEVEVLAVGGALSSITTAYLDPASAPAATAAVGRGEIDMRERSELLFNGALHAAAARLPFWPTRGSTGSDVARDAALRTVACPYTGEEVIAVPAVHPQVTLLHVDAVLADGTVLQSSTREFLDDADVVVARAARHVVVATDTVIDDVHPSVQWRPLLASFEITGVVVLR